MCLHDTVIPSTHCSIMVRGYCGQLKSVILKLRLIQNLGKVFKLFCSTNNIHCCMHYFHIWDRLTYCILLIYSTYLAVAAKKEKLKMLTCIFLFCIFAKEKNINADMYFGSFVLWGRSICHQFFFIVGCQ